MEIGTYKLIEEIQSGQSLRAVSQYTSKAFQICIFSDSYSGNVFLWGMTAGTYTENVSTLSFFPLFFIMAIPESHLKYKLVRILSRTNDQPKSSQLKQKRVLNNWRGSDIKKELNQRNSENFMTWN